jgi:uncharacterized protein YecA (UPF0149 family)
MEENLLETDEHLGVVQEWQQALPSSQCCRNNPEDSNDSTEDGDGGQSAREGFDRADLCPYRREGGSAEHVRESWSKIMQLTAELHETTAAAEKARKLARLAEEELERERVRA